MIKWEQHFNKLQQGLIFDEKNPNVTDISENENCNKKLIKNDAGPSQNKSHDRHKKHLLDKCVENMVKGLRAVPKHLNIDKKKRWTFNLKYKNFPTKHLIQKRKAKKIAKIFVCATKNLFGIRIKKTSSIMDHGQNVTIAKDIMNYI